MVLKTRAACLGLTLTLVLGACSAFQITDSYGNRYGGWYEHGDSYATQLDLCERETATAAVAATQRAATMRECMWRNGVPKDNTTPAAGT